MMNGFWLRFWILVVLALIAIVTAQVALSKYFEVIS